MKTINDLLKDNNPNIIDAEKVFNANGEADPEYIRILSEQKPLIPTTKEEGRLKYFSIKENRDRYINLPERLPTKGMMPFPTDAHEQIGQYESKHNLYLTTATTYNKVQNRLDGYVELINILIDKINTNVLITNELTTVIIDLKERITKLENTSNTYTSNISDTINTSDNIEQM